MKEILDKIRSVVNDAVKEGRSKASIARKAEMDRQNFGRLLDPEKTSEIKLTTLYKIAEALNVNVAYLMNLEPLVEAEFLEVDFISVNMRSLFIEYTGQSVIKGDFDKVKLLKEVVERYENPKVFEVDGNSMLPQLNHSSRVVATKIDPNEWCYASGVVIVVYGDYMIIKRLLENKLLTDGFIVITSDYPPAHTLGEKHTIMKSDLRQLWKVQEVVCSKVE